MASKILLVVIGVAVVSVVASAAPPAQPPRIQADVVVMGYVPCNNGTSMKSGSAPGFPSKAYFSFQIFFSRTSHRIFDTCMKH
jgi:hypothetical protein